MKLHCENLVKKYGIRTVVKGVSMEINQGEIVGFLGPNGAGKTTSFYMITGQIVPNGGRVFLDDEDITELPMYKRAQKGVGYLPQEASVFRKMSVEDNIMSVMEMSDMSKAERQERLEDLINEFNLSKVRKSLGIQLSGGERRRCEIARALAIDPKFILLDEPFAGVDPIAVEDIQFIIAKLKYKDRRRGCPHQAPHLRLRAEEVRLCRARQNRTRRPGGRPRRQGHGRCGAGSDGRRPIYVMNMIV